ncbi:hypothetical protein VTJ04DRAFT_4093 [Mycothermus thermophilus]
MPLPLLGARGFEMRALASSSSNRTTRGPGPG